MNDNDKTKTYGNVNSNDKTGLYKSDSDHENKTGLYGLGDGSKTGVYSDSSTASAKFEQGIAVGDALTINNTNYRVVEVISEGTGEANVFKIENDDKKQFALKLYYEFRNVSEEPNGIALGRIQQLDDPDILKLISFGVGPNKYLGKYCYEISEFAFGGNLFDVEDFSMKYTPSFIESEVIPQIYLALTKLHEYKIYHCDLKPGNILYKDKEQTDLILGDYGSAKAYDLESEKSIRKSSTVKGTEFYLPPEQARGIVSEKNDYYSFGMVLLHLLYPNALTAGNDFGKVDNDKFEQIVERQYSQKPIVDFNPVYKRLNNLIEGLTLLNHLNRWGPAEVERWMNGETIDISYYATKASDVKPLKLGPVVIADAIEFTRYLETKASWFEDLFEDEDVYKLIKDWLDSYIGIPDRKRFEKLVSLYRPAGKAILKEAVCMFFAPDRPLIVENQNFNFTNTNNINKLVSDFIAKIDENYRLFSSDMVAIYIFKLEFVLKSLYYQSDGKDAIKAVLAKLYTVFDEAVELPDQFDYNCSLTKHFNRTKGEDNIYQSFIKLAYALNPERPYIDNNNKAIADIEELAVYYVKNKDLFEDKYHKLERTGLLQKFGNQKVKDNNLKNFCESILLKHSELQLKINYISFEKICQVHYSVCWVLDTYLKKHDVDEVFVIKEDDSKIYAEKNTGSTTKALQKFMDGIESDNGGQAFSEASLKDIKNQFTAAHRKYFRLNNIVSAVSIVLIVGMLVAIVYKITV